MWLRQLLEMRGESHAALKTVIEGAIVTDHFLQPITIILFLRFLPMISINSRIGLFAFCAIAICPTVFAETLYERLGGEKGVTQFVEQTIDLTASDPVTKRSFEKVDLKKLKMKIAEHICALTDGPCKYAGDPMKIVHQGLDITEAEFFAMVEILRGTLNRSGVSESAKNELLRILAPMKRDIVSK